MAYENAVERLHREFLDLQRFLDDNGGFAFRSAIEGAFPKTILLAAASHFERRLTEDVRLFAEEATSERHVLVELISRKVIVRRYHSWFDWRERNANQFLAMFGDKFKAQARQWIRDDPRLQQSVSDFMEIGEARNNIAHDFGDFTLEKTVSDVYGLYGSAKGFVEWFPDAIRRYSE